MTRQLDAAMKALQEAGKELATLRAQMTGARNRLIAAAQQAETDMNAYEASHDDDHDYLHGKAEGLWQGAQALTDLA